MDIVTRPATIPLINQVTIAYCCVYLVLLVMWMVVLITMKELILGVMVQDVGVSLERPDTLILTMTDKVLMVIWRSGFRSQTSPSPSHH